MTSQPICHVFFYDEENGLPHGHVTQLLQDSHGFLWFSTWNGLCRYDGYEFQTFKPSVGDGCHMGTDRIRDISPYPDGNILCRVDDDYYLFDTRSYRFLDLTQAQSQKAAEQMLTHRQSRSLAKGEHFTWTDRHGTHWTFYSDGHLVWQQGSGPATTYELSSPVAHSSFSLADRQGNLWILSNNGIYKLSTDMMRTRTFPQEKAAQTKCLYTDRKGRLWVTTKEDATVRIFAPEDDHLSGYLTADGRLHPTYHTFGHSIYCIHESRDGTFWMGSKPDGLFRIHEKSEGQFSCEHITNLTDSNVYSITDDNQGRLWVATLGGGILVCENPQADTPSFHMPTGYPHDGSSLRVRNLYITQKNILMAATTDGLLIARLERQVDKMRFRRHCREPERSNSLSSSATMDILEDSRGKIYICTESGGLNLIESANLEADQLSFRHINTKSHQLPSDVTFSLTNTGDQDIMVVGSHFLGLIDSLGHVRVLDSHFFNAEVRFSDAHPQYLGNAKWIFGLNDGALTISTEEMHKNTHHPHVVLTGATVQGELGHWDIESHDTLTLLPQERNVTIHFAAIDYQSAERINYAFRLVSSESSDTLWNPIGHNRSITLLDLAPGKYLLEIRSTDAEGQWLDNTRCLVIELKPRFWESTWGHLLAALLLLAVISGITGTCYYIRWLKRQQHETLEAYLALLNTPAASSSDETEKKTHAETMPSHTRISPEDDAMMKHLMAFIEENIENGDLRVADLASAVATSPSGLQRKLKYAMGITPQDLLREARIKHACQLLKTTDKNVSEVAYACGFNDPKYFSRCFKTSTGKSPTEYRNAI